jgi:hypothetical protein
VESVMLTEMLTKMLFRNTIALVAAPLTPCSMLRLPPAGAMLLPHGPLTALMHLLPLLRWPLDLLLSIGALTLLPVLVALLVLGTLTFLPVLILLLLMCPF